MAGADTIIKLIATILFIFVLMFVFAVGVNLMDPIYEGVIDQGQMNDLGWGSPQDVVYMFATIGLVGMGIVVLLWWVFGFIRDDVRQEVQPRRPF